MGHSASKYDKKDVRKLSNIELKEAVTKLTKLRYSNVLIKYLNELRNRANGVDFYYTKTETLPYLVIMNNTANDAYILLTLLFKSYRFDLDKPISHNGNIFVNTVTKLNEDLCRILLTYGADINSLDNVEGYPQTVYDLVEKYRSDKKLLEYLRGNGAKKYVQIKN